MNCIRHDIKMIKDKKTGLEFCIRCAEVDAVMDDLHDAGEWDYNILDVESYLRGPDRANIKDLFQKKEKADNGQ